MWRVESNNGKNSNRFGSFLKNTKKFIAFTLAETLIVMGIIGVVAALTIPNLNSSTNGLEQVTKIKKTYAELSEAFDSGAGISFDITNIGIIPEKDVCSRMDINKLSDCIDDYGNGGDVRYAPTYWIIQNGNLDFLKIDDNGKCPNDKELSWSSPSCK